MGKNPKIRNMLNDRIKRGRLSVKKRGAYTRSSNRARRGGEKETVMKNNVWTTHVNLMPPEKKDQSGQPISGIHALHMPDSVF